MLEVIEFRSDFQSVRHKKNQTYLEIIGKHFWIGVSWAEID